MEKTELKMRPTTDIERNVCEYLNDLRESGETNMFGARPYVEEEFGLSKPEAGRILSLWMKNFNDKGNYENVKED